jgi:hypothetical protein
MRIFKYVNTPTSIMNNKSITNKNSSKGENMENIEVLTSKVQQIAASFSSWSRWANIFIVVVMIALACLYFTQYMATKKAIELGKAKDDWGEAKDKKTRNETEIKIAEVKANSEEEIAWVKADSDKQIALLTTQTAQADAEAAKANEKAESERLARIKLEADIAPRVVTTTDKEMGELSLFSGTRFLIQFEAYDIEAHRLAGQIGNMLMKANWNILGLTPINLGIPGIEMDNRGNTIIYGASGVRVYSKRTGEEERFTKDDNRWNDAAKIVTYHLNDNKIETYEYAVRPQAREFPPNFPDDAILIVVASKPQPYFTDKQLIEIRGRMGILKDFEEDKRKQEQRMEEDFKKIPDPEMQELLEESRQRKESIVDIWDRRGREKYKEYQKEKKEKILQKYK